LIAEQAGAKAVNGAILREFKTNVKNKKGMRFHIPFQLE
jgi:hypothetical protein